MAKSKRDIGKEIPDGIRELKRVSTDESSTCLLSAIIRERTGLSQSRFAQLLESR